MAGATRSFSESDPLYLSSHKRSFSRPTLTFRYDGLCVEGPRTIATVAILAVVIGIIRNGIRCEIPLIIMRTRQQLALGV